MQSLYLYSSSRILNSHISVKVFFYSWLQELLRNSNTSMFYYHMKVGNFLITCLFLLPSLLIWAHSLTESDFGQLLLTLETFKKKRCSAGDSTPQLSLGLESSCTCTLLSWTENWGLPTHSQWPTGSFHIHIGMWTTAFCLPAVLLSVHNTFHHLSENL